LNYRWFFLVFSLADAVIDPIVEGEDEESNRVPTDPNRRFELRFRLYGPTKALFDQAWTLAGVETISAK
jgi:hypothetical protein